MFQIAIMLTFEDGIADECLVNVLEGYRDLGTLMRGVHASHMLLSSVACPSRDERAKERVRRLLPNDMGVEPSEAQVRAKDIITLVAHERGEEPRFDVL